jgi:hypothetical protein
VASSAVSTGRASRLASIAFTGFDGLLTSLRHAGSFVAMLRPVSAETAEPSEPAGAEDALAERQRLATSVPRSASGAMLLWGAAAGVIAAVALLASTPGHWPILGTQATELRASLAMLRHGGPLLLGRHGSSGSLYAIGTEEEGMFVYFPFLSHALGVADPVAMVRYLFVAMFTLTAAIYPLVFYKLTRSVLAGLAAPIVMLVCVESLGSTGVYWAPAWAALTLLPLIYLLLRDWPRFGLLAVLAIAFTAGCVSSLRAGSGLGVLISAALLLLLIRRWRWWRVLAALALVALAYTSVNSLLFAAVREHRNARIGASAARAIERAQPSPHVWHTMYIGLGYLPNDYGIRYRDGVAQARVQRDAPGTRYLSARYDTVIRRAYFSVVRHHPFEVIKQYAAKILVTAAGTSPYLLIVLLGAPAWLLIGADRRIRRRWLLLVLPAIAVSYLPTVIAIPTQPYEQGLYGALGVVGVVGLCWMLAWLELEVRARGARGLIARLRAASSKAREAVPSPYRRTIRLIGMGLATLVALVVPGHFISRSAERWQGGSSGVLLAGARSTPGRPPDTAGPDGAVRDAVMPSAARRAVASRQSGDLPPGRSASARARA